MTETISILITSITVIPEMQPRVLMKSETVQEYRDAMQAGEKFPPVTVYFDGTNKFLADGYHRIAAASALGLRNIDAEIIKGSKRDAMLYSCGANARHGLQRGPDDKRRAVKILLEDEEWGKWSNNEIARRCAVSEHLVREVRGPVTSPGRSEKSSSLATESSEKSSSLATESSEKSSSLSTVDSEKPRKVITKHGTETVMKTAKIGKPPKVDCIYFTSKAEPCGAPKQMADACTEARRTLKKCPIPVVAVKPAAPTTSPILNPCQHIKGGIPTCSDQVREVCTDEMRAARKCCWVRPRIDYPPEYYWQLWFGSGWEHPEEKVEFRTEQNIDHEEDSRPASSVPVGCTTATVEVGEAEEEAIAAVLAAKDEEDRDRAIQTLFEDGCVNYLGSDEGEGDRILLTLADYRLLDNMVARKEATSRKEAFGKIWLMGVNQYTQTRAKIASDAGKHPCLTENQGKPCKDLDRVDKTPQAPKGLACCLTREDRENRGCNDRDVPCLCEVGA